MSPETRDFLAAVRHAEAPSPGDESRVLAALEGAMAAGLAGAAAKGAPATKGALSTASAGLKVVGALLGVSVGTALVMVAVSSGPAEPAVATRPRPLSVSTATLPSSASAAPSPAPPTAASAPALALDPPRAPQVSKPTAPAPAASTTASLRDEIALLAGVQAALERGDGAEALRQLDQHITNDRQFVAERRAARISALCRLGRVAEARALTAVFLREHAQSVQRPAVERSCGATKADPER